MIRAVLSNGAIQPLDPLPPDWPDGQELRVEPAATALPGRAEDIDHWYQELESLCASADPEDDQRLQLALAEAHERAKAMVRRDMGLE